MPSSSVSPAELEIASGIVTSSPPRSTVPAARLSIASGGVSASIIQTVSVPRIERLRRFEERGGRQVQIGAREQYIQQRNAEEIEAAFKQQNRNIEALQSVLNVALEGLARATAIDEKIAVEGSYTSPLSVGSANSSGTVTISAHTRYYSGSQASSVSVNAGSVTGQSGGDYVTVFYRDAARAGGAVTYEATTNAIAQTGNIHIVWQGTIPAAGEPANEGTSPSGPGYTPPTDRPGGGIDYEEF